MDVGIDLGTTFSLASYVTSQGVPALASDAKEPSLFSTPSVIHIDSDGALVGNLTEQLLLEEPTLSTARFFKLRMGDGHAAYTDEQHRPWRAETLSALVLMKLARDVRASLGETVDYAVITVPAGFGDAQRRATRAAATLAGLTDIQLVEEPVAAAVYYGLSEPSRDQTLLVYDFGGGTFDATVLQASPKGVYAVATNGVAVGGKDIDATIVELIAAEFARQHKIDPRQDPAASSHALRMAIDMKLALGNPGVSHVRRTLLLAGKTLEIVLTRVQFEHLATPLLEKTFEAAEKTIADAGLTWSSIDRILLAGGSSLLPLVSEGIRRRSGKCGDALVCRQPHQSVAFGAGILANRRSGTSVTESAPVIRPISSFDLGLRVQDKQTRSPAFQVLIPRNSPMPARNAAMFYTTRADQQRVTFEVVQRKDATSAARSVGYFEFGPIKAPRKNYPIEVTLAYDVEGVVTVSARDVSNNQQMARAMAVEEGALDQQLLEQRAWLQGLKINGS